MTAKRIAPSTVALIDPEKGTSTGGSSTDVNYAVGDVLTFILQVTPVGNNAIRSVNGYVTEYIPANTQVVGVRFVDKNGNTLEPNRAGQAPDGWGLKATNYSAFSLGEGRMASLYADTGIFYSTSSLTARVPSNALPTVSNGVQLDPAPSRANEYDELLGVPGGPYYVHNTWDYRQAMAYGTQGALGAPPGGDINKFGKGNTPFEYGSPVAGPNTYYKYEASLISPGLIEPNGTTGPWVRIAYPGSQIGGTSSAATTAGNYARTGVLTTAGHNLSTANPLPTNANAVRFALGQMRVGEQYFLEVSLKVNASPLDPSLGDVNCGEVFGGGGINDKVDNPWAYSLTSVNCVKLNLLFEKNVDTVLATSGATVTYTIRGKNLSKNPRTNVVVTDTYIPSDLTLVSATGNPTVSGGVITWPTIANWTPGAEFEYTVVMTVAGVGQGSTFNTAKIDYILNGQQESFSTSAIVNRKTVALLDFAMQAQNTGGTPISSIGPGGTFRYQVTITNNGNGEAANSGCNNNEGCVYGVTLPPGFSVVAGTSAINGSSVSDPTNTGGTRWTWSNGVLALLPGASAVLTFNVTATSTTGLYTSCAEAWLNSNGPFNDEKCKIGPIAVGGARSDAPVITTPVLDTDTCVNGTSTEAVGTVITVYVNGTARGTTTVVSGTPSNTWSFCTADGLPPLYGGVGVSATAQAPGENVSVQSAVVTVLTLPKCSDNIDNDNDGLIDFPADPGCSSPLDSTEEDPPTPQCSDTIDNDGDNLIDLADPGCSSPSDTTEGGAPECSDGVDNDGDGNVDFPADTGCTSATDATEVSESLTACNNGVDDDGDGKIDFKADGTGDPGCHSKNDTSEVDPLPSTTEIKPRLLIVFDTSGSMNWNTCNDTFTGGDGSQTCAGADVSCATCNNASCGNALTAPLGGADDSRIHKVKRGITSVVGAYGSVEFGLMRFHQRGMPFACPTDNASYQSGGWQGAGASPCAGGFSAGDLLVSFADDNAGSLLQWIDGSSNYSGTPPPGLDIELRGTGTTPLAGTLASAHAYIAAARLADPKGPCRPYRVILVTDGLETCGGNPVTQAQALNNDNIKVTVIGFATSDANIVTQLNNIANAGGTTSALLVDNETSLAIEMSKVISESLLTEVCNNADDNCNGACDENFPRVGVSGAGCTNPRAAQTCTVGLGVCERTGSYVCKADGTGSECNVTPGQPTCPGNPVNPNCTSDGEICGNGLDDDCDGLIDEGCVPCVPQAEVCNGRDDNCNGLIDENYQSVACGINIGQCTPGTTACVNGSIQCNGATGPSTEVCDNVDNNCDGIVDLISRACYPAATAGCDATSGVCQGVCRLGTQTCTTGTWGSCTGATTPTAEVCDGLDNDCDGQVDEGVSNTCTDYATCTTYTTCGACPPAPAEVCDGRDNDCNGQIDDNPLQVGQSCGNAVGTCTQGTLQCVNGSLTCQGGTQPTTETCDGLDNDCDGVIDNNVPGLGGPCGSSTGTCQPGTLQCIGGQQQCVGATGPSTEVCDGLDNDCDGQVDNGIPSTPCGSSVGACTQGTTACVNGNLTCQGGTQPTPEVCDGIDNDCNGLVDDNPNGVGGPCGSSTGTCQQGTLQCVNGQAQCIGGVLPKQEVCDGLDNDCDGTVDNNIPGLGDTCGSNVGECRAGQRACVNVPGTGWSIICQGAVGPQPEICDGLDNDCDGTVDNNVPQVGTNCGSSVGACVPGQYACVAGQLQCQNATGPTPEVCDGIDNDCDGVIDNNPTGIGGPCGNSTGTCQAGTLQCIGGQPQCIGAVGPSTEVCDGLDNNCDGQVDNGIPSVPCGSSVGACTQGSTACVNGQLQCQGGTRPTAEVCDGIDNDCNGLVDDNPNGVGGPCGSSTGTCQQGTLQCVAGQPQCIGGIGPKTETCDGLDNDCDGTVDNNIPGVGGTCGSNVGECKAGQTACVNVPGTGWSVICQGAIGPKPEVCDGLDNDCNGQIDDNVPQVGTNCSSSVGECVPGKYACVAGQLQCQGGTNPSTEICDGKDNDCDGVIDNNVSGVGGPCGSSTGTCKQGTLQCVGGQTQCVGSIGPTTEVCDNKDNDCDGQVDNGIPSVPCGSNVGQCTRGATACVQGQLVCQGGTAPTAEVCDGIDNDCNGVVDDNPTGVGGPCGSSTGECKQGVLQCVAGQPQCIGGVGPQTEICDGKDNDCDGQIDNSIPTVGDTCGTDVGECKQGTKACVNVPGAGWALVCQGSVGPKQEVCDGLDNNCDGQVDETDPKVGQTCSANVGACKGGFFACVSGQLVCQGGTAPTPEVCDGVDNDCNGAIDDNVPGDGDPCTSWPGGSTLGLCKAGVQRCIGGKFICVGEVPPAKEICDGKDNDCDGVVDNAAECPGGGKCQEGQCVLPCGTGEFACPGGFKCKDGFCIPNACATVTCQNTERCVDGKCISKCDGVSCDPWEKCDATSGNCVDDSCLKAKPCKSGEVCVNYKCVADPCPPGKCPDGQQCSEGKCYDNCVGVTCPRGQSCIRGKCTGDPCANFPCQGNFICVVNDKGIAECKPDPCRAVVCPGKQVCIAGSCKDDPCSTTRCPTGTKCELTHTGDANCKRIEGQAQPKTDFLFATGGGGCSCRTGGDDVNQGALGTLLPLLIVGLMLGLRRRRRRRRRADAQRGSANDMAGGAR